MSASAVVLLLAGLWSQKEGVAKTLEQDRNDMTRQDVDLIVSGLLHVNSKLSGIKAKFGEQMAAVKALRGGSAAGTPAPALPAPAPSTPATPGKRGYEVLHNTVDTHLPFWKPSVSNHIGHGDQPIPWNPSFPELCKYKVTETSPTNKLPGWGSKRIAFTLRGDSFRGLSYGKTLCMTDKKGQRTCGKGPFYCTEKARAIQKATAASHLKNMVGALEEKGAP